MGANVGVGFTSENIDFGLSFGGTAWSKHLFTGGRFFESRFGAQMAVGTSDFKMGFGNSSFSGGGIDQTTGSFVAYGKDWSVRYENDYQFGVVGDSGDRWRTTGLTASVRDFSLGLHFATGDPGPSGDRSERAGVYIPKNGSDPDAYRLGSATLGYRGTFAG